VDERQSFLRSYKKSFGRMMVRFGVDTLRAEFTLFSTFSTLTTSGDAAAKSLEARPNRARAAAAAASTCDFRGADDHRQGGVEELG